MSINAQLRRVINELIRQEKIDGKTIGIATSTAISLADAEKILSSAGLSLAIILGEHSHAMITTPPTAATAEPSPVAKTGWAATPTKAAPAPNVFIKLPPVAERGSERTNLYDIRDLTTMGLGSKSSIYRNVAKDIFPKPFKSGGRIVWREAAIVAHLQKLSPV